MRRGLGGLAAAALLLAALAMPWAPARAQDVVPVPALTGRVIDQTATLTPPQVQALEGKLAALESQRGAQLVVLVVPTTQPEDDASFAQRVGEAWKIGRAGVGDGLLIVVAKNDRKIRIEVAKALEGAVPDLAAKRIVDETIRPAFRANDYAGGLNAGIDAIAARIAGEGLPEPARSDRGGVLEGFDLPDLALFLFFAVPVIAGVLRGVLGRKLGALATGGAVGAGAWWLTTSVLVALGAGIVALVIAGLGGVGRRGGGPVIWGGAGGGGGGGWSSGGGGGGGFSSGGGGDFGGGGASGSW